MSRKIHGVVMKLEDAEKELGDPANFVLSSDNHLTLRRWAVLAGNDPVQVYRMTAAELTNLYHGSKKSSSQTLISDVTHAMFLRILQAVSAPGFNVELTQELVAAYLKSDAMRSVYENAARKVFETLPPRALQVSGPNGVGLIEGTIHYATEKILRIVSIGHPVMMVGPAGCGKTTIVEHIARGLNLPFYITNAINDTHELIGFIDGHGKYHITPFRNAFQNGGVWVADEIDAWNASVLLTANSALANGYIVFPDDPRPVMRHPAFRMVATANTFGTGADRVYIGRNELDAASLDRFATIEVDYDVNLERQLCNGRDDWLSYVWNIRKIVTNKHIRHVVSTRAISNGSAALNAGLSWNDVASFYLFKGMSIDDRKKVEMPLDKSGKKG